MKSRQMDDFPTCRDLKCVCFDCQLEKRKPSGCRLCPGRLERPDCRGYQECRYEPEIPWTDDGRDRRG